ncbi:hypothetical protein AA106_16825 [Photorhabdus laumondii subsp. laumondii]|uniref:tail fiber protein n=1 Tax=Photorhabdus laumondii TaxID=2218628 RepID=UPI0007336274|nr:tail fiber protein [Photorhabdus laumondii]KTL59539.1 hypothetical protein AA106_16825 [Photorhabdus laumondii subsp. laumondii]
MEKEHNPYNSETNLENTNIKSTGPSADDLKSRFKEGSIPLQTDYADLINIADIGRKACGQAPQQNGPGQGLKLTDNGTLNLKIGTLSSQDFSPLMLKDDILSVNLGSGLINKTNGICVGQGNGIVVNSNDVTVKANNGINVNTNGVSVKSKDNTIKVESTGISVGIGWGVRAGGEGLDVKASNGINVDRNGVSVKAGNGITVDSSGVSIDPKTVLPKGMIVMFSGSSAPTGWALCDGTQGTPNLIDRFIIGGKNDEVGKTGGQGLTGSGSNKTYTVKTSNVSAGNITVNISGTALEAQHIPPHAHSVQYTWNTGGGQGYTVYSVANAEKQDIDRRNLTDAYGNPAEKHTHTSTATQGTHGHTINSLPAYYILAFIMKL